MKNVMKTIAFVLLFAVQKVTALFYRPYGVATLMYHSVGQGKWTLTVSTEEFERQIKYLAKKKYEFMTAERMYLALSGKVAMPEKGVLITFDDGYKDILGNAVPVLKKYNIPAVMFVHTDRSSARLDNNLPLLDWNEIKILKEQYGFEIASHSHSHPKMKELRAEAVNIELETSENELVGYIGAKPLYFAYPRGIFSGDLIGALKDRGYRLAFTINPGLVKMGQNPFMLKRIGIRNDTSFIEFRARTTLAGDWYEEFRKILRGKQP